MTRFACLSAAALMAAGMAGPALAQDLVFTLSNNSAADLIELYASPAQAASWEENILAGASLPSGGSGDVTIAGGREQCAYDLRMVFSDGDVLEDSTDLCATGTYAIN